MKVHDPSALLAETTTDLLERPLADYARLLREAGDLSEDHLRVVDHVLRHTALRLLGRAAREEELEEAYDAFRTLVPVAREDELAAWAGRWRAFADLLDSRLAVLASQDPAAARRLAHAEKILALVARDPGLSQVEIGERLQLKPANLTRILGVLEANELIERQSAGREKRVYPGRLAGAPAAAAAPVPASGDSEEVRRPIYYLTRAS